MKDEHTTRSASVNRAQIIKIQRHSSSQEPNKWRVYQIPICRTVDCLGNSAVTQSGVYDSRVVRALEQAENSRIWKSGIHLRPIDPAIRGLCHSIATGVHRVRIDDIHNQVLIIDKAIIG